MNFLLEQAITSANYEDIAQANLAAIQTTVDSIASMENEIYANFTTEQIGDDLGEYWYNNMTIYIDEYVGKVNNWLIFMYNSFARCVLSFERGSLKFI